MKMPKDFFTQQVNSGYTHAIEGVDLAIENLNSVLALLREALTSAGTEGADKAFLIRSDMTVCKLSDIRKEVLKIKEGLKEIEINESR